MARGPGGPCRFLGPPAAGPGQISPPFCEGRLPTQLFPFFAKFQEIGVGVGGGRGGLRQFLEIEKLNLLPTGSYAPVGSFRPGATQTDGVEIIKRRRCLGSGAFVTSAPASPSRADERNVGEEIGRLRCVVALFTGGRRRAGGTNRRPHSKSEKSPLLRYRQAYFPGGVDFA